MECVMPYRNEDADLQEAQKARELAKRAQDPVAKRRFQDLADRYEQRAGMKANKKARKRRNRKQGPRPGTGSR